MNGRTKVILFLASFIQALLFAGVGFLVSEGRETSQALQKHKLDPYHPGAVGVDTITEMRERITRNEERFEAIQVQLDRIERKISE